MENLKACRICLDTDIKLYDMFKYRLKTAFENLTGLKMAHSHYPRHICSYCGTMLEKFTSFKQRCVRSQHILDVLLVEHALVTTDHIKSINRHTHNLTHPYTNQFIQNISTTIEVKEETGEQNVKPDINNITEDFYFDQYENENNIVTKHEILHNEIFSADNDRTSCDSNIKINIDESDEEPLSTKVKKQKRKKSKKELKFKTDIKSEDSNSFKQLNVVREKKKKAIDNIDSEHRLVILTKQEQIQEVLLRKSSSNYQNSMYKCDSCFKGFMTESTYTNHMARHDPSAGALRCDVCHTHWPDLRALRAHSYISHERKYVCKQCGHESKTSHKAQEHSRWHAGVTYPCAVCGASFRRATTCLTHARLRHAAAHACGDCGAAFVGEHGLRVHRKRTHAEKPISSTVQLYECETCHTRFKSEEALLRHSSLTSETGCGASAWVCLQCGDSFNTEEILNQHMQIHLTKEPVWSCNECSRTFAGERSLSAHRMRAHTTARRLADKPMDCVCEICGYKCIMALCVTKVRRQQSVWIMKCISGRHSGEKPYACGECPARFSVRERLKIHMRTHTGERPFQCPRCPKAFKHKAALNRHDRVHTGVKPYTCPQCGKTFSQSNSMKQHCAGVHMKMYKYSRKTNKQTV